MKVILLGELRGKGGEGDVVDVAQGYAENYLFPNRMAIAATPGNIKQLEERRHNIAKREERRIADAEATKAALDGKRVLINVKVGEEGQLYGSVTTAMIAEAIKEQIGAEIDRKKIDLRNAIKQAGEHTFTYSIYREIRAELSVKVVDEENPEGDADEAAEEDVAEEAAPAEDEAVEEEAAAEAEEEAEAEE